LGFGEKSFVGLGEEFCWFGFVGWWVVVAWSMRGVMGVAEVCFTRPGRSGYLGVWLPLASGLHVDFDFGFGFFGLLLWSVAIGVLEEG
jgi:hypothetical protein